MEMPNQPVLTINCGSSSIRFAVYLEPDRIRRRLRGKLDLVGSNITNLTFYDPETHQQGFQRLASSGFGAGRLSL